MNLLSAFYDAGYSIVPCDPKNKKAKIKWKHLQGAIDPTTHFDKNDSIAIICGAISGNVEIIDFDLKYDLTGSLYTDWSDMVNSQDASLLKKVVVQKTRNGGFHLIYKYPSVDGNQPLARRAATLEEQKNGDKVKVLIETRGEGGYAVVAPSDGYSIITGDIFNLSNITNQERDTLFSCAKAFDEVIEVYKHKKSTTTENYSKSGLSPFDDYNDRGDCIGLLQKHGWTVVKNQKSKIYLKRPGKSDSFSSGNFDVEKNWFSVFSTSTQFETNKAYLPYAVYSILEHKGDFIAAIKNLYQQGFGDRLQKDKPKERKPNKPLDGYLEKFWSSHTTDKGKLTISFSFQTYKDWLHQVGFFRYCYGENQYMFINVTNNIISRVYKKDIRKAVLDHILSLDLKEDAADNDDIFEYIAKNETKIFSDGILEILDERAIEFCKDDRYCAYFYFRNCVVVITKEAINTLQYSELPGWVWNTQIIDKELSLGEEVSNDYRSFLMNISGHDNNRFDSIRSVIGYLLHGFKDYSFCPAIVLNDEVISEDPEGGTGKGLFISGIKAFKKTHIIDGKNFVFSKNFAFQSVNLDTQLIAFEDVRKDFDLEKLFSIITEGITVEKKNKDEFFIPFTDSPKIIITTNYTVSGRGNSSERRKIELEFRQYYNKLRTPLMDFGRLLFHDWNKEDWNRFYRFMFSCVKLYLTNGIIRQSDTNLDLKHIQNDTCPEFLEFVACLIQNKLYNKKEVFSDFIAIYPDFSKLRQRKFTLWLTRYSKFIIMPFLETKINKDYYFSFGEVISDELPF